jgi:hypothetical protein
MLTLPDIFDPKKFWLHEILLTPKIIFCFLGGGGRKVKMIILPSSGMIWKKVYFDNFCLPPVEGDGGGGGGVVRIRLQKSAS